MRRAVVILAVLCCGTVCFGADLTPAEQDELLKAALKNRSDAIEAIDRLMPRGKRRTAKPQRLTARAQRKAAADGADPDRLSRQRQSLVKGSNSIFSPLPMPLSPGSIGALSDDRIMVQQVIVGQNGRQSIVVEYFDPTIKPDAQFVISVPQPATTSGTMLEGAQGFYRNLQAQRMAEAIAAAPKPLNAEMLIRNAGSSDQYQVRHQYVMNHILRVIGTDPATGLMAVEAIDTTELERRYREACAADPREEPSSYPQPRKPAASKPAANHYESMLSNARSLISAKVYDGAEKILRRIITEAPDRDAVKEAQKELDSLPRH